MISLLSVLFLVLTTEAAPYINDGSGVAHSISATEIDVSWTTGFNTGTVKTNDVTAVLLGGGGIAAKQTVSGAATQCTLSGLKPGRYYSIYVQPHYSTPSADGDGKVGDNVRIGTFKTKDERKSPATLVLGILCGIVGTACLVIVIMNVVLKKQQGNRSLENNLANAYVSEYGKDSMSACRTPSVLAVPVSSVGTVLQTPGE